MKLGVDERKFEIDSLAAVIKLQVEYYQETKDNSIFTENYKKAL